MKKYLLFLTFLLATLTGNAQSNAANIIGHYRHQYYVLKVDDHYILEWLQPLKFNKVVYDTLLSVNDQSNIFKSDKHTLLLKDDKPRIAWNKRGFSDKERKKYSWRALRPIDEQAIKARSGKHNYFYHNLYS